MCFDIGEVLIDETRVWSVWAEIAGLSAFTLHAMVGAAISSGRDFDAALDRAVPGWRGRLDEHETRYGGFRADDLYDDVRSALGRLADNGWRLAACGNQPAQRRAQLEALQLPVEVVRTSADLGAAKPDGRFFHRVLEILDADAPGDVLYVGDRLDNDVRPAATHGLRTAWVRRGPWALLDDGDPGEDVIVADGLGVLADILLGSTPARDGPGPGTAPTGTAPNGARHG